MCELPKALRFCTCKARSLAQLTHFWVFYRFDKTKDDMVIGRVALPDRLDATVDKYNRALLLARLHEDDAFDLDLDPREGDLLAIAFRCTEVNQRGVREDRTITYGYKRTGDRWVDEPFNHLEWQWHHHHERFGKLRPTP